MSKLAWLHISDIHFLPTNEWQDSVARAALLDFLEMQLRERKLNVDLIFCTGDIAFGALAKQTLGAQYAMARKFFDEVLAVCGCDKSRLFAVPGNHDIDRSCIREAEKEAWARWGSDGAAHNMADKIPAWFANLTPDATDAMRRLTDWGAFVSEYLPHQKPASPGHHHFAQTVTIQGRNIGVAGFNSAWTCAGDTDDRTLWLAAGPQFDHMRTTLADADVRIGLIHHPSDWFNIAERGAVTQRIGDEAHFWLHGHTHDAWVEPLPSHVILGAGAVTAGTESEFGCNLVQLDFDSGKGVVWPFRYQKKRARWVAANDVTPAGGDVWPFALPSGVQARAADTGPPASFGGNDATRAPASAAAPDLRSQAIQKLDEWIANALGDDGAKFFKQALCQHFKLAPDVAPAHLLVALDALPGLAEQLFPVQRAIINSQIEATTDGKPHPVERAALALAMRAAVLAVDLSAAMALCGCTDGLSDLPEKNEVLIAVLMAALLGEVRGIRLQEMPDTEGRIVERRAVGEDLLDLDEELPFCPLRQKVALADEVACRVDKLYIRQAASGKQISDQELVDLYAEIRFAVEQQRAVEDRHFRFVVSPDKLEWAQDLSQCSALYHRLGIPVTRIVKGGSDELGKVLAIKPKILEKVFMQILHYIRDAKEACDAPHSGTDAATNAKFIA